MHTPRWGWRHQAARAFRLHFRAALAASRGGGVRGAAPGSRCGVWGGEREAGRRGLRRRGLLPFSQENHGLTLSDLPLHMLNNILYRLSDGWDIVTLGQVSPTLRTLSEDRRLWKKLCQYHFAEKQVRAARGLGRSVWLLPDAHAGSCSSSERATS